MCFAGSARRRIAVLFRAGAARRKTMFRAGMVFILLGIIGTVAYRQTVNDAICVSRAAQASDQFALTSEFARNIHALLTSEARASEKLHSAFVFNSAFRPSLTDREILQSTAEIPFRFFLFAYRAMAAVGIECGLFLLAVCCLSESGMGKLDSRHQRCNKHR
jgi:hypothetical protein